MGPFGPLSTFPDVIPETVALYALRDQFTYAPVVIYFSASLQPGYTPNGSFQSVFDFITTFNRLRWTGPGVRSGNTLSIPSTKGFAVPPRPSFVSYNGFFNELRDAWGRDIAPFSVLINPL